MWGLYGLHTWNSFPKIQVRRHKGCLKNPESSSGAHYTISQWGQTSCNWVGLVQLVQFFTAFVSGNVNTVAGAW